MPDFVTTGGSSLLGKNSVVPPAAWWPSGFPSHSGIEKAHYKKTKSNNPPNSGRVIKRATGWGESC